jgi:hypothetical protein
MQCRSYANVGLWRSTAAITSIAISPLFGAMFLIQAQPLPFTESRRHNG